MNVVLANMVLASTKSVRLRSVLLVITKKKLTKI